MMEATLDARKPASLLGLCFRAWIDRGRALDVCWELRWTVDEQIEESWIQALVISTMMIDDYY